MYIQIDTCLLLWLILTHIPSIRNKQVILKFILATGMIVIPIIFVWMVYDVTERVYL